MKQKCIPVHMLIQPNEHHQLLPRQPGTFLCPFCGTSTVHKLQLLPMTTHLLDLAVQAKKKAFASKELPETESYDEAQTESSYLLLSSSSSSNHELRTGRWTEEEMEFCDFLMHAFDRGLLPMAEGVRLNDFLCTMLLCKASRLTKKMKNARLSSRSYQLCKQLQSSSSSLDYPLFSKLQDKFLSSVSNVATRYELHFHSKKAWRTNISNLCVQVSSALHDAHAWMESLEVFEGLAAAAEDSIRKARRRRMGLALKTDVQQGASGVYFSGVNIQAPPNDRKKRSHSDVEESSAESCNSSEHREQHISSMLDLGESLLIHNQEDTVDDFATFFTELIETNPQQQQTQQQQENQEGTSTRPEAIVRHHPGSFLDEVMHYSTCVFCFCLFLVHSVLWCGSIFSPFFFLGSPVEKMELPFAHADVWVPSYKPQSPGNPNDLRLYHAGHATRCSLDAATYSQLFEFGEYSTKFSFAAGSGLPGRVYSNGMASWECRLDEADPTVFERAGGAKVYGIKTGIGIPISSSLVGRMVVALYSQLDLHIDQPLLDKWSSELTAYCPKPQWKLVVDMEGESKLAASTAVPPPAIAPPREVISSVSETSLDKKAADTKSSSKTASPRDTELTIASLLGEHMPGADSNGRDDDMLSSFISLRLMLLRGPDKRSSDENGMVEVILKSHAGFATPNRSPKEVAVLVARDWKYLRQQAQSATYSVQDLEAPAAETYSSSGAPFKLPFPLGAAPKTDLKKRRISLSHDVNIVDESS